MLVSYNVTIFIRDNNETRNSRTPVHLFIHRIYHLYLSWNKTLSDSLGSHTPFTDWDVNPGRRHSSDLSNVCECVLDWKHVDNRRLWVMDFSVLLFVLLHMFEIFCNANSNMKNAHILTWSSIMIITKHLRGKILFFTHMLSETSHPCHLLSTRKHDLAHCLRERLWWCGGRL